MNVVIDTNVFISGIFWKGDSYKILEKWKNKEFALIISSEIIDELIKVLKDFKIRLPDVTIRQWTDLVLNNSILISPDKKWHLIKDDPDDDKFMDAAIEGNAEFIITQDKHILRADKTNRIRTMTPKDFIEYTKNIKNSV